MRVRAAVVCLLGLPMAAASAAAIAPPLRPRAPVVAYVTQSLTSSPSVWVTRTDGTGRMRVGAGSDPLIAPSGQQVAVSLFGSDGSETGPAIAIYRTEGGGPTLSYLSLTKVTARPLAWSRDLRYVAVAVQANGTPGSKALAGLAVIDIGLNKATLIARGAIYGASFAPSGPDVLVFGRSASESPFAKVDLYTARPDGSGLRAITNDGRSLNPVWGPRWIAYDRERQRSQNAPEYQIWLRKPAGAPSLRRLTNVRVGLLVSGLVPLAFGDEGRLLAEFEGQDTSEAWTVNLVTSRARRVSVRGRSVQGAGISADGSTLLVEEGAIGVPASSARIATLPFAGGRSTVVVAHGAQASWTGR
jgi:hypothetical protein